MERCMNPLTVWEAISTKSPTTCYHSSRQLRKSVSQVNLWKLGFNISPSPSKSLLICAHPFETGSVWSTSYHNRIPSVKLCLSIVIWSVNSHPSVSPYNMLEYTKWQSQWKHTWTKETRKCMNLFCKHTSICWPTSFSAILSPPWACFMRSLKQANRSWICPYTCMLLRKNKSSEIYQHSYYISISDCNMKQVAIDLLHMDHIYRGWHDRFRWILR